MIKKNPLYYHRNTCRGCNHKALEEFLDLGNMPLAGGFIKRTQTKSEKKIPLKVYYCKNCGLVQILDIVDPKILFKKYFYISSVIKSLSNHFYEYSNFLKTNYLVTEGAKLLEFGCNDGVLLQYFANTENIHTYGIDPSHNVSKIARSKGFNVTTGFFNKKTAIKLMNKIGTVDVVTGSNVFAHTDDIHEIIEAAKIMLKKNGVFIIEVHYLKDLITKFQYDTIYHEHLSYYSVTSLQKIFAIADMKIIKVMHLDTHGGSLRVIATKNESDRNPDASVDNFLKQEVNTISLKKLVNFGEMCQSHRKKLQQLLSSLKKQNKSIVGYGASGRGTILLNYCNINSKYIDYIVDVSPLRINMLMPGVHVPIYDVELSRKNPPDYFLIIAWNYLNSIMDQEKSLREKGVKFIVPFPRVRII